MTGDISRKTFDPARDYSLVRMQQGRLFTDADWNEQGDILRTSDREAARDVIGHAGFPDDEAGFALVPEDGTGDLVITPGSAWVGGVRHVAQAPAEFALARVSGTGGNARWRIDGGETLADDDLLSLDAAGLKDFVRVRDFAQDDDGVRSFRTTPALGDATQVAFRVLSLRHQPYGGGVAMPEDDGAYLAVLKSTEAEVSALDDPTLREVAFDGPDTATRDRTLWQVQLFAREALDQLGFGDAELTCPALAQGFNPVAGKAAAGRMRARAELSDLGAGPCTLPPAAGYRSLDNLLYRVEIHRTGDEAGALYKWSRDNAQHRTRYRGIDAGVLLVDDIGRDEMTALAPGDWIEIRDQARIDAQAPGFFARIGEVIGTRVSLDDLREPENLNPMQSNGTPDTDALPTEAFVTRWDGGLPALVDDATGDFTELDNGVQVQFGSGFYECGDHWTIPARAVTGDVEWPRSDATGAPLYKPAEGPRRDYAALAWLERSGGTWKLDQECRPLFPPLTRSKQVSYAGGDGQEALDDPLNPGALTLLPRVLSVAVTRGHRPVEGERIRFRIQQGNGQFGNGSNEEIVLTDAGGGAGVQWSLDGQTRSQRCFAQRLDAAGTPTHAPIAFNATLSRASHVSFDPENTPELGPANTVQKAIEALAAQSQVGCTTYVIQPGQDWVALLEGIGPEENAAICFARGIYHAGRAVRMQGAGHIRISGAGPGAVQIVAQRTETAIAFEGFASVAVSNIGLSAPDGNSAIADKDEKHRKGTLDFSHCTEVEVHGCTLDCGGGTSARRTCLSVRGRAKKTLNTLRVASAVRITGNTLSVGHLQEGILVSDAIDVDIRDNTLTAKSGKGAMGIDAFLTDKAWVAQTAKDLVARPVKGNIAVGGGFKQIAGKEWRMTFNSPVPQTEWDALVAENPPGPADTASDATFKRYADSLIARVVEEPKSMPSFVRHLDRLGQSFGSNAPQLTNPDLRKALLVTSDPDVHRFDSKKGDARGVVVEANGHVVSFDSPFSQRDWLEMVARSGQGPRLANADELLKLSQSLALRALTDAGLRANLGSVEAWLGRIQRNGVGLGHQGIVCGGQRLDNVSVRANHVRGFQVGIRVAVSHLQKARLRARSIIVEDNRLELLAPNAEAYAGYGMMVGNVETLRIRGNELELSDRPNFRRFFKQGIRIWGYVGHHVLVAENRIAMATMGIRLKAVQSNDKSDTRLWVFRENLIRGPKGTRDWKVDPSSWLTAVNNLRKNDL